MQESARVESLPNLGSDCRVAAPDHEFWSTSVNASLSVFLSVSAWQRWIIGGVFCSVCSALVLAHASNRRNTSRQAPSRECLRVVFPLLVLSAPPHIQKSALAPTCGRCAGACTLDACAILALDWHGGFRPSRPLLSQGAKQVGCSSFCCVRLQVVLSTNIAETSITIDDIGVVIDCGRAKDSLHRAQRAMASRSRWP